MSDKLEKFVQGASHLPALPTVIGKLLSALNNPSFSIDALSRIIATDTSLSAKVLKMANSVFYYRVERVATVDVATVRLGHKTLRSLVLTVWTQTFKTFPLKNGELGLITPLLEHGTATAVAASLLIQPVQAGLAEDAYLAGLLHDIGRLALICQLGPSYDADILQRAIQEQALIQDVEREVLGFDHAMLGARLLQSWHIPVLAVQAAADHHRALVDPLQAPMLAAVALANDLTTRRGCNVAPAALRQQRNELEEFFRLTDLPAFVEKWDQKLAALHTALEGL